MRSLEILLVAVNLVTFFTLVVPLRYRVRWMRLSAVLPLLAAGAQVVVEGPRWPLVPAYALGALLALAWVREIVKPAERRARRRWPGRLAASLGGLGLVASTALPVAVPVFHFPSPTGLYQIGTVTYHWVDSSRHEIFSGDPKAHRQLMAQIWYPVEGDPSSARAPYVQDAVDLSPALAGLEHLPPFAFDHLGDVPTHAIPSAPIATDRPIYPVLIYLTGLGGFRQVSTFQVEELVSHGYVVVGIDQPYAAAAVVFPDGDEATVFSPRGKMQALINQSISPAASAPALNGDVLPNGIIPYFAQDVGFTLDQLTALDKQDPDGILTGRLDLEQVGTFGISLGAMVGAEACHADPRLKACLLMDAAMPADVVMAGLKQPTMWITRDAATMRLERQRSGGWAEWQIRETLNTMRAVFANSPSSDGYYVQVPGIFHVDFTDFPLFTPLATQLGLSGPLGVQRAHDIVNAYSVAFFDHVLNGRPSPQLDGLRARYPAATLAVS